MKSSTLWNYEKENPLKQATKKGSISCYVDSILNKNRGWEGGSVGDVVASQV